MHCHNASHAASEHRRVRDEAAARLATNKAGAAEFKYKHNELVAQLAENTPDAAEFKRRRNELAVRLAANDSVIRGTLEEMTTYEIGEVFLQSRGSGEIRIRRKDEEGLIQIEQGCVVHAEVGDLEGEDAFYRMLLWHMGEFIVQRTVELPRRTIQRSIMSLYMMAVRLQSMCTS